MNLDLAGLTVENSELSFEAMQELTARAVCNAKPERKIKGNWKPWPFQRTAVVAEVYQKDVVFRLSKIKDEDEEKLLRAKRGAISGFSPASRKRLRMMVRNTTHLWTGFVTVTYPEKHKVSGREAKAHIHALCKWFRKLGLAYIWILEFQKNNQPHFHFLVSGHVPIDRYEANGKQCRWNAKGSKQTVRGLGTRWDRIVKSGHPMAKITGTQVKDIRKNTDSACGYMQAYMTKLDQKFVPPDFKGVGRFWGASRCLTKTFYRMTGPYCEVAENNLAGFVELNQHTRLSWADMLFEKAEKEERPEKRAEIEGRALAYQELWKWKGYGFSLIGGADDFRDLLELAVKSDKGWAEWDGKSRHVEIQPPAPEPQRNLFGEIDANCS